LSSRQREHAIAGSRTVSIEGGVVLDGAAVSDSISLPDDSLRDDSWPGGSWTDDLPTLLRLSRLVAAADPDGRPRLDLVYPQSVLPAPRRLAFLAGSFNPPHSAHLAMSRAALDAGFDRLVLTLSKRTVDKASVTGLGLADRLLLLRRLAEEQSRARGAPPETPVPVECTVRRH